MKKSSALYVFISLIWLAALSGLWYGYYREITASHLNTAAAVFYTLNYVFISYFWINGIKDFTCVLKARTLRSAAPADTENKQPLPKVVLLYCTCNDFDGDCLFKCMAQDYPSFETVILDDSSDQKYRDKVDEFAASHAVKTIRRNSRKGFKAGNINNYLKGRTDYDYLVILDSDEIIPPYYIAETLKYFDAHKDAGIVQANHVSSRNTNGFMETFHIGVNSHWPNSETLKTFYGFASMFGHGAMLSRCCYDACGGFPEVVAEDLCMSVEARFKGYRTLFAPEIICEEQYPVDFTAFRKRQGKFTEGNLELIKKYGRKILKSKMRPYEKADLLLSACNIPLTALFSFLLATCSITLSALGVKNVFPIWLIIPSALLFVSPLFNDFVTYAGKISLPRLISYFILSYFLYGATLLISLTAIVKWLLGKKAVFTVTPKNTSYISPSAAVKYCKKEIIFGLLLIVCGIVFSKNLLVLSAVILLALPSVLSPFLCLMSNKTLNEKDGLTPSRMTVKSGKAVFEKSPRKLKFLYEKESRAVLNGSTRKK